MPTSCATISARCGAARARPELRRLGELVTPRWPDGDFSGYRFPDGPRRPLDAGAGAARRHPDLFIYAYAAGFSSAAEPFRIENYLALVAGEPEFVEKLNDRSRIIPAA